MKTKSFAMVAAAVLLTASIAGVAPAMAEDSSMEMPMEQTLAENSSGASMQPPADNSGSSMAPSDSSQSNPADMGNVGAMSSTNDEGTPDTATGDDDY